MKLKLWTLALCSLLALGARAEEAKVPTTSPEKMAYAVGVEFANKFKKENYPLDVEMVVQGLRDTFGDKVQMDEKEVRYVLNTFQVELRRKIAGNRQTASMNNRERNEKFFTANKSAPGVQVLPSGVQYKIIKAGDGPKPTDANTVTAIYRGTLLDGRVFDHSEDGKPSTLRVANLVTGWRAAVSAMPLGSHWQVWIPANLAFGERGTGNVIGTQEPLVIDIEILGIETPGMH